MNNPLISHRNSLIKTILKLAELIKGDAVQRVEDFKPEIYHNTDVDIPSTVSKKNRTLEEAI